MGAAAPMFPSFRGRADYSAASATGGTTET